MKNLKLLNRKDGGNIGITEAYCFGVDNGTGTTFLANSFEIVAVKQSGEISARLPITDGDCKSTPICLEFLFDHSAVCLATKDGRICLWQYGISTELEDVGEVDTGIMAMAWSPDYELVIVATGDNKLIVMTSEFDVITEMSVFPSDQGEDSNIAVGWGKKETQFHGRAGKEAAKQNVVEIQPISERDAGDPVISWRGDGQFFALSVVEPQTGARFVYTWSRECIFQAKSEAVNGLQQALCWKPSGSLIASVQVNKQTNRQDVVFFEKNGLRHGEFALPVFDNDFCVKEISWNQDSTILALHIDEYSENNELKLSYVQLWTVNNYHWYLKQNMVINDGVAAIRWDSEHAYTMQVLTRSGHLVTYIWAWTTDCTSGLSDSDMSVVAVIDGDKLLVTPLRKMVVPPPMAAFTLKCPTQINAVAFSEKTNDFMVFLCIGKVALFHFDGNTEPPPSKESFQQICNEPTLQWIYDIKMKGKEILSDIHHLTWIYEEQTLIMATQGDNASSSVLLFADVDQQELAIVVSESIPVNGVILNLCINPDTKHIAVQLASGEVLKLMPSSKTLTSWVTNQGETVKFPSPCAQLAVTTVGQEEAVLGLTERFRFFVNNVEVSSSCTSFGIHKEFLLLSTLTHTLRCLPKSLRPEEIAKLSIEKEHPFDENIRRVERGSRIVSVVGGGIQVVLQMPRGNLETIQPRALLVNSLKKLMDRDQIHEAFLTIRKHRINMNLLYDHNPKHFLENVEKFIKAVNNQSYLNVFLTDIIEEDVTQTMYSASYSNKTSSCKSTSSVTVSKVDTICDAFLKAFERLGVQNHIQSVLTALARKTQPELEKALQIVWSLHDETDKSAEAALSYILFLVDVNTLYEVALGTYNFDLVMMVAQKSQKDPKEYIPFLNKLRRLEDNYRFYSIDKYLKKFPKALIHITKCGEEHFEECLKLVSEHKLYGQALQLYKPGTSQFKRLAVLYGDYLMTKNRHEEAGIEFTRAEEWSEALEAFRRAHDWQQVFCMGHKLSYTTLQLSDLANKVAGDLKSRQKFSDAAAVLLEYTQDCEEGIVALIEGCHWKEALRQMHKHHRLDLVETHLLEALQESWENHTDMLVQQREQFDRHKSRLLIVREQKEKAAMDCLDGAGDFNDAEADLFSDTTSLTGVSVASRGTSNSSRSTVFTKGTGSARTRRKADNKKWSLKEGSVNEEFALVDAAAKLIKAVDGLREDVGTLLRMLMQFNFNLKANELQERYNNFLHLIQTSIPEIWIYSQKSSSSPMALGPNMTANSAAQALQRGQLVTGEIEKLDPVVLAPPVLNKDSKWKLHSSNDQDR